MKRVFPKMALMLVLITALAFLISSTASAHNVAAHYQTTTTSAHTLNRAASCPPTIEVGSTGSWVKQVQSDLNLYYNYGIFPNSPYNFKPQLKVDGKFGSLTRNAVKDWQEVNGLVVDGIVGSKTWQSLGYC